MRALARYQRRSRRSAVLRSVPGRLAARALGGAFCARTRTASLPSRLPHARSVQAACALVGQPAALPRARARSCCQRSNDAAEVVATVLRASVGAARARRRTRASTCTSLGWTWGSAARRTRARQSSPACTTAALSSAPTRESQQARVALRTRVYTQRVRFPSGRAAALVLFPLSREGGPPRGPRAVSRRGAPVTLRPPCRTRRRRRRARRHVHQQPRVRQDHAARRQRLPLPLRLCCRHTAGVRLRRARHARAPRLSAPRVPPGAPARTSPAP